MSKQVECFWCEGSGIDPDAVLTDEIQTCILCDGKGTTEPVDPDYVYEGDWFE